MSVLAKHKITGKLALVTEGQLKVDDNLVRATAEDRQSERAEAQIRVFGHTDVRERKTSPSSAWTKAELLAYAEHKKISVDDSITKAELLKALQEEG